MNKKLSLNLKNIITTRYKEIPFYLNFAIMIFLLYSARISINTNVNISFNKIIEMYVLQYIVYSLTFGIDNIVKNKKLKKFIAKIPNEFKIIFSILIQLLIIVEYDYNKLSTMTVILSISIAAIMLFSLYTNIKIEKQKIGKSLEEKQKIIASRIPKEINRAITIKSNNNYNQTLQILLKNYELEELKELRKLSKTKK